MTNLVTQLAVDPADQTVALRSWGLSDDLVTSAPVSLQPFVASLRAVNLGNLDPSALAAILAGTDIDPAAVALAHPPTAAFTVVGLHETRHFALTDDADLELPAAAVLWDFGDGSAPLHGAGGVDHTYPADRDDIYLARCTVSVAGDTFQTVDYVTVGEGIPAPVLDTISPEQAPVGPPEPVVMFVYGANFTRDSKVIFGSHTEETTVYLSPGVLSLEITAGLFPGADPAVNVQVTTPPPGGGTSTALTFAFVEGAS
jgi:hypothetical protein